MYVPRLEAYYKGPVIHDVARISVSFFFFRAPHISSVPVFPFFAKREIQLSDVV